LRNHCGLWSVSVNDGNHQNHWPFSYRLFAWQFLASLSGRSVFGKVDIRKVGSGNAGTTNVIRVLGWKQGMIVFILDALKGVLAAAVGKWLGAVPGTIAAASGVVIGHDFPILLGFHGGKGIAATTGIYLFLFPLPTLICLLILATVVLITRIVSLGSLAFVACMTAYMLLSHQPLPWILLSAGLTFFAFIRHAENIQRISKGTENKLSFGEKKK